MVESGLMVTRGSALFAVADTSTFLVSAPVDEVDINKIEIGQRARISSDAFAGHTVQGTITGISAEATENNGASSAPKFLVRAEFSSNSESLKSDIRIGMTAQMTVETYRNSNALLVPPDAIETFNGQAYVKKLQQGTAMQTPVKIGASFPGGIEIVSGLEPNDEILVSGTIGTVIPKEGQPFSPPQNSLLQPFSSLRQPSK